MSWHHTHRTRSRLPPKFTWHLVHLTHSSWENHLLWDDQFTHVLCNHDSSWHCFCSVNSVSVSWGAANHSYEDCQTCLLLPTWNEDTQTRSGRQHDCCQIFGCWLGVPTSPSLYFRICPLCQSQNCLVECQETTHHHPLEYWIQICCTYSCCEGYPLDPQTPQGIHLPPQPLLTDSPLLWQSRCHPFLHLSNHHLRQCQVDLYPDQNYDCWHLHEISHLCQIWEVSGWPKYYVTMSIMRGSVKV